MLNSCFVKLEEKLGGGKSKYVEVAKYEECRGNAHLDEFFQNVIESGGEGIILRDPSCLLEPGRSLGCLKHKVSIFNLPWRKKTTTTPLSFY